MLVKKVPEDSLQKAMTGKDKVSDVVDEDVPGKFFLPSFDLLESLAKRSF
jgi:hypothetical protein